MFTIEKTSPTRVVLHLSGPIDGPEMQAGLDALLAAAEGMEHGELLYIIDSFPWPSASALAIEFGKLRDLFGLVHAFDRCAVLADAAWLRTVAEIKGALMPGLDIKGFAPDARAEAEAWLRTTATA